MTTGTPRAPTVAPMPQESSVAPKGTVTTGTEGAERESELPPRLAPMLPLSIPPSDVDIIGRARPVLVAEI